MNAFILQQFGPLNMQEISGFCDSRSQVVIDPKVIRCLGTHFSNAPR
jgi:hypothetical protein